MEGSPEDIPEESYDEQLKKTGGSPVSTYVPFRNGLLIGSVSVWLMNGILIFVHIYYLSKIKKSEETTNEKNQNQ